MRKVDEKGLRGDDFSGKLEAGGASVHICQQARTWGEKTHWDGFFTQEVASVSDAAQGREFLDGMFGAAAARAREAEKKSRDGAFAAAALVTPDGVLNVANVGPACVTLFIHDKVRGTMTAEVVTGSHRASSDPAEWARIKAAFPNARKDDYAGEPLRHFGHTHKREWGVTDRPDIKTMDLKEHFQAGRDVYVCVSDSGMYVPMDSEKARNERYVRSLPQIHAKFLQGRLDKGGEVNLSESLRAHADSLTLGYSGMTILTAKVSPDMDRSILLSVAVGWGGGDISRPVIDSFARYVRKMTPTLVMENPTAAKPATAAFPPAFFASEGFSKASSSDALPPTKKEGEKPAAKKGVAIHRIRDIT